MSTRLSFKANFGRASESGGVARKFRSNCGLKVSFGRTSGIPRLSTGHEIRKIIGNGGVTKAKSRQSLGSSLKYRNNASMKSSVSSTNSDRSQFETTNDMKNKMAPAKISASKCGPVFKEVIPLQKKSDKNPERKALSNLSNSPIVKTNKKPTGKIPNNTGERKITFDDQKDILFEADPNALASILNNEGITTGLLHQENADMGRPSMVKNNTLLMPDGRPSLCRRVPIRPKVSQIEGRLSFAGPRRVLSVGKKGTSVTGQRNSFIKPIAGGTRHSLYSVVQGRYSNAQQSLLARQSLQPERKQPDKRKTFYPNSATKLDENKNLQYKSPGAQRVLSQKNEVRISASPALRILQPTLPTPPPRRVRTNNGNRRAVKWADENSPCVQDKLAVHLFQESPNTNTPTRPRPQVIRTPVSILKSRKHGKRNSLTPPTMKKDKKGNISPSGDGEEDVDIEIVSPQVINESKVDGCIKKVGKTSCAKENGQISKAVKTEKTSPSILARKVTEMTPKVKSPTPTAFQTTFAQNVRIKNEVKVEKQQNVVEVDEILQIMNQHLGSVKRRSVQAEFSDVIKHITASLKGPAMDVINEDGDQENEREDAITKERIVHEVKVEKPLETSPVQIESVEDATTKTIEELRGNCDEGMNKSLDEIAMETERINEELRQLKLKKEKLSAFQEKVKNYSLGTHRSRKVAPGKNKTPPQAITSEKCPNFSQKFSPNSPAVENSVLSSWDMLLKSDMENSPRTTSSNEYKQQATSIQSRSLEFGDSSPAANMKTEFFSTASPQVSALNLETFPTGPLGGASKRRSSIFDTKQPFVASPLNTSNDNSSESVNIATAWPFGTTNKLENEVVSQLSVPDMLKLLHIETDEATSTANLPQLENRPPGGREQEFSEKFRPLSNSPDDRLMVKQPIPLFEASPQSEHNSPSMYSDMLKADQSTRPSTLKNTMDPLDITVSPNIPSTEHVPFDEVNFFGPNIFKFEARPDQIQQKNDGATTEDTNNKINSIPALGSVMPSPLSLLAPAPVYPLPPQTPAAFRALRLKNFNSLRASPFMEGPKSNMKQHFAQALLDEEVSLLTCRVVRPSALLSKPSNDPVAQSLSVGDETHFVPILKTPSCTPKRNRRSSFSGSAFSKYLHS